MKKNIYLLVLFLFCMIFFAACGLGVKKIPSGTILSKTPHDYFQKVGEINLHYREYPGSGPDVFMLHGFASSTYSWEKIAPAFVSKGYHVWMLDLKGAGWSDKPKKSDYSPITLMEEVNAFLEAKGLKDVIFIGNSLGGAIGVLLTIDHPDKVDKLILIDAAGYFMKKPTTIRVTALHGASFFGGIIFGKWMVKNIFKQIFFKKERLTDETINAYYDRLRTEGALASIEVLSRALDFSIFEKYKNKIPLIDKQTLIIWGKEDKWIPLTIGYKYRLDITKSKLVVIPECGHAPQEELPDETAQCILDYLDGKPITETPVPLELSK